MMNSVAVRLLIGAASGAMIAPACVQAQAVQTAVQAYAPTQAGGEQAANASPPSQPTPADPANGIADIIVTANKTGASRLQDTPLAISAFSSDQLAKTLSSNVKDIAQYTPGLNISLVTTSPVITVRGIGTNNVFNGSDPDVTMQVDGVYIARPSAMGQDFLDVERVEVLRGPQGTLYGRNAIGGTINVISRVPTDKVAGQAALTVGNYHLIQGQGFISGPIVPGKVQASLSGSYTYHDNYEKNIAPGGPSGVNNANHGGVRGQIRIEPADWVDLTTRGDYVWQDENLQALYHLQAPYGPAPLASSIVGDYSRVAINTPSTTHLRSGGVSEEINFHLTDQLNLKSITAVRFNRYELSTDNDGTEVNAIAGHFNEEERQHSQEINLSGKFGILDAVVGGYYFDDRASTNVYALVYGPGVKINSLPHFFDVSKAGFAQGDLHVTPTLTLTAGIRYTTENKSINSTVLRTFFLTSGALLPGFPIIINTSRSFDAWTPKFGVNWKVTPNVLLYFSATRGYKSGGTNYAATSLATSAFDPESLWSYEGGFKSDLFDRRVRLNVTAFHYDYSNLQIQSVLQPGITTILNAAQARVNGVEVETTLRVTPTFRIDANLSGLDAKYTTFLKAPVPTALAPFVVGDPRYNLAGGSYDASGKRLNQAPRFSGNVGAEKDFKLDNGGTVEARADVYFQGRVFYEPTNSRYQSQPGYALVNAQLSYTTASGLWRFSLFGKNLADKRYLIAFQANGVEPAGTGAPPRTFGGRVSRTF